MLFNEFLSNRAANKALAQAAEKAAAEKQAKFELADKHGLGHAWGTSLGRLENIQEQQETAAEKAEILAKIELTQNATVEIAQTMQASGLLPSQLNERQATLEARQADLDDYLKELGLL